MAGKVKKTSWKKGQSGNPNGRPKNSETWAGIIRELGDMYAGDILLMVGTNNDLGRMLYNLPRNVQMKYLVTARVFASLMFEPSSGLWKELMERAEGKVKDTTLNVNLNNLTNEQLERIANGEDPLKVVANA